MVKINSNYDKLAAGYLFPEIAKRTKAFLEANPGAEVMKLGIGNTTEVLTKTTLEGLHKGVDNLSHPNTYTGYGGEPGNTILREAIAKKYSNYGVEIDPLEVFVSDGAKPDSGNIQSIFSKDNIVAVQDPAYPVYVNTNVIAGRTGESKDGQYDGLIYMQYTEENCFFPKPPTTKVDIIYLCSPNNPTGAVATHEQLKAFVDYARENKAVQKRALKAIEKIQKCNLPITFLSSNHFLIS